MSTFEDNPPNTPGRRLFDEHAVTIPPAEIKTPPPTLESEIMAALLRIEKHVRALDIGLATTNDELSALRADMNTGFDAVRTMLIGDGTEESKAIAQEVGRLRDRVGGALGAINALPPRLTAIETKLDEVAEASDDSLHMACTTWLQVTGDEVDEHRLKRTKEIAISYYSRR